MKRRSRAGRGSKKQFTRTALKTHKRNIPSNPMRGGIRL